MLLYSDELLRLDAIREPGVFDVNCKYYKNRFSAILELVRSSFLRGESSLIILNEKELPLLSELIIGSNMENFYLEVAQDSIKEQDWYRLKEISKKKLSTDTDQEFELSSFYYKKSKNELSTSFENLNKTFFGTKTLTELQKIANKASKQYSPSFIEHRIDQSEFSFTEKEFWQFKNTIEEAVLLYDNSYLALDHNLLSDSAYILMSDKEELTTILDIIQLFITRSENLLNKYYLFKEAFISSKLKELDVNYKHISIQISSLFEKIDLDTINSKYQAKKSSNLMFRKSKKDLSSFLLLYDDIIKYCGDNNIIESYKIESYQQEHGKLSDISELLRNLELDIEQKFTSKLETVQNAFKKLNVSNNNISNKTTFDLNVVLDQLILDFNKVSLLKEPIVNNSLSIFQQIKQLEKINTQFASLHSFIKRNSKYVFWNTFFTQQSVLSKMIIGSLRKVEVSSWLDAFVSWYLNQLIKVNTASMTDNDIMNNYKISSDTHSVSYINYNSKIASNKQISACTTLKKNNKKEYNDFLKKSNHNEFSYSKTVHSNGMFFQSVFPITVICNQNIEQYDNGFMGSWDNIYISEEKHKNTDYPNSKLFFFKGDMSSSFDLFYDYTKIVDFRNLTTRQQLEPAKQLASRLVDLCGDSISLFVSDRSYIVSTINNEESINSFALENNLNIQSYNNSGNLIDNLTDIMLVDVSDMELVLFIENGVLNAKRIDCINWQLELLDLFKDVGFVIEDSYKTMASLNPITNKDMAYEVN